MLSPNQIVSSESTFLETNKGYILRDIIFFSIFVLAIIFSILLNKYNLQFQSLVFYFIKKTLTDYKNIFSSIKQIYEIFIGFPGMLFIFINPLAESFNPYAVVALIFIIGIYLRCRTQSTMVILIAIPVIVVYLFFVLFFGMWVHNPNFLFFLAMILVDLSFIISITYFVVRITTIILSAIKKCFQNIMKSKLNREVSRED